MRDREEFGRFCGFGKSDEWRLEKIVAVFNNK
jgi:hypothetical protein